MDSKKNDVIQALEECRGIVTEACRKAGIARSTYYLWIEQDPEFKAAAEDVQEQAIDYVEGQLFKKITGVTLGKYDENGELQVFDQPPSDTAIIFYLKTKGKKRGYIERQEVESSGSLTITWNEQKTYETK